MEKRYWKVLLGIGILFHILAALMMPIGLDAHVHSTYVTDKMDDGEGHLEWGELRQDSPTGSTPIESSSDDRWFAWHLIMQVWFTLFGNSIFALHLFGLLIGLACLGGIYFTSSKLVNDDSALQITALVSIYPPIVRSTGRFYQESAILLLVTISLYFIIKALRSSDVRTSRYWIFPVISVFIIASMKGMPFWMGMAAVIGLYLVNKIKMNMILISIIAFMVELVVVFRNSISLMNPDIIPALLASFIAAYLFVYCAMLLGKRLPEPYKYETKILYNSTLFVLACLIGWVAGLWVTEAYYSNSNIFEIIYSLSNNPRYLSMLFTSLLIVGFLESESFELIDNTNQTIGLTFISVLVLINVAILSAPVEMAGGSPLVMEDIGSQLNGEISEGEDILFVTDSKLAMHRMYSMKLTLDPESDKDNIAIWRTTDSGWKTELTECNSLLDIEWIIVGYSGISEIPDNWIEVEIDSDLVENTDYKLLKWGEDFARCP